MRVGSTVAEALALMAAPLPLPLPLPLLVLGGRVALPLRTGLPRSAAITHRCADGAAITAAVFHVAAAHPEATLGFALLLRF